jgi:hypothetical protein
MRRKCKWCGQIYDSPMQSSIWCSRNPRHGRGASRLKQRIFTMIMLPGNGYYKSKIPIGGRTKRQ